MIYAICELHVVVWFLRTQGNTVVNINRILRDIYAENGLPDDLTLCQRWKEFLVSCLSLVDEERRGGPHISVTVPSLYLALKKWCSCTTSFLIRDAQPIWSRHVYCPYVT